MLTINILEKGEEKDQDRPNSIFYFSIMVFVILLIIIFVIILILVRKRSSKKDSEVEENQDIKPETPPGTIPTIKPETIPIQQQDETLEE